MNKQGKIKNGKVIGGIEWTKTVLSVDIEIQGATSNAVGGCRHRCRWVMPDGSIARCYAEEVAEGVASAAYPNGFEHHYWRPEEIEKWQRVKQPLRIFWDSMSDLFGHWVPEDHIRQVLAGARLAHWHTFQSLTKNPVRMLDFDLPVNVWAGTSSPPDFMWGKQLSRGQQERMLRKALETLDQLAARSSLEWIGIDRPRVTWMSFEPLSWDVSGIVAEYPRALRWAVIGAASNGPKKYQPDPAHVQSLLDVLDRQGVPVFFKGNLDWSPWREDFPNV